MNERECAELARLKLRQMRLEAELGELAAQLKHFEQRLGAPEAAAPALPVRQTIDATPAPVIPPHSSTAPAAPSFAELAPPPIPPIMRAPLAAQPAKPSARAESPAAPQVERLADTATGAAQPAAAVSREARPEKPAAAIADEVLMVSPPIPSREVRSFEMRLGTYWLVRIGIVMVLTALVFFGNLAYQNYISRLGPGGKVALLYLASAALLGAGWWWQRQAAKASLRNYAQVLFAGGTAAVYFTTYAAHHLEPLRVIQSPLLDGILLLLCAGWMVWIADRKKSEVMALFAVGLAYYTSIITRVGSFTLCSNLVLTVAAVIFLVRNRWAVLSFASLLASYAGYGFWRFFNGADWQWASPSAGLWSGAWFLMAYWVVFTSAVFLSRDEKFAGQNRAAFLTLNNGAFFALFVLTMLEVSQGGFWKFSMLYGGVLLGLAEWARRTLSTEPLAGNAYLTQGLLLVTVGLISKFAGLQLALLLAAESVVLLLLSYQRPSRVLRAAACIAALLAVGWGMDGMEQHEATGLWLAIGLGAMMLVNAVIVHRHIPFEPKLIVRPQVAYFTALALIIGLVAAWNNASRDLYPITLALAAVGFSLSIYFLRVPEISLLGQGYLLAAQLVWCGNCLDLGPVQPWWNPALMIALSLGLSHWWQTQKAVPAPPKLGIALQLVYAAAIVAILFCWLNPKVQPAPWLALSAGLAVALTAYGVSTRAWYVAACGQAFIVLSAIQFLLQLAQAKPGGAYAAAPLLALALLSGAAVRWFQARPGADSRVREQVLELARVYRWVALAMSIWWVCEYVPGPERIWLLALIGLLVFLWAGWKRSREGLLFSAPYTLAGLLLFWLPLVEGPRAYWPNLVAIVVLLAQRQIARRSPDRYPLPPQLHTGIIVAGGLSLWLFVSRWVLQQASGFYLTASWSLLALALFTCGILLRERVYRWLGLGILACALGRVMIFDVWKLETLYCILSFMALGIVLLGLGFIYNKYQEKIREWL